MNPQQNAKLLGHFARHLFLLSNVHKSRNKSRDGVYEQLQKMRKSIIRMRLRYSDIDTLKEKIENLINWERKYAKFFKPEDTETEELKNQIKVLEDELLNEREEKYRIMTENNEKIKQLNESLENVKSGMKHLLIEKAKRHQRLQALDRKIREKVDVHNYYHS